jgi:hypothetical protein
MKVINSSHSDKGWSRHHCQGRDRGSSGRGIEFKKKIRLSIEWIIEVRNGTAGAIEKWVVAVLLDAGWRWDIGILEDVGAFWHIGEMVHR